MPFTAHGRALVLEALRMQQHPNASPRRTRAGAGIMLGETATDVGRPPDVSQMAVLCHCAEDIDEAGDCARDPDKLVIDVIGGGNRLRKLHAGKGANRAQAGAQLTVRPASGWRMYLRGPSVARRSADCRCRSSHPSMRCGLAPGAAPRVPISLARPHAAWVRRSVPA